MGLFVITVLFAGAYLALYPGSAAPRARWPVVQRGGARP